MKVRLPIAKLRLLIGECETGRVSKSATRNRGLLRLHC